MAKKRPPTTEFPLVAHVPSGYVRIAEFRQVRDRKIVVLNTPDELRLSGALDLLTWGELHLMLSAYKSALVLTEIFDSEQLISTCSLVVQGGTVLIGLELWGPAEDHAAHSNATFESVAITVANALASGSPSKATQPDFFSSLPESYHRGVGEAIETTLQSRGGYRFAAAISIDVGTQQLKVEGRLRPKPDRSNHHPKEEVIRGQPTGFDVHIRLINFQTEERRYQLSFSPEHVDLVAIAQAIVEKRTISIRLHTTQNQRGKAVHSYVADAPFKQPSQQALVSS